MEISSKEMTTVSLKDIKKKTKFSGTVIKTTLAGGLVDIGIGIPGFIHISQLQKDPVNRVEDVIETGKKVDVWIKRVDSQKQRIDLTMIEPFRYDWRELEEGLVVQGKVVEFEKIGVLVEIGAESPAFVHISEVSHDFIKSPNDVLNIGDQVEAKVLSVNQRKKQIKLSIKALLEKPEKIMREVNKPVVDEITEEEEIIPTAMEIALRDAMSKSTRKPRDQTRVSIKNNVSSDLENVLNHTLAHKVSST